jgi:hypothetical protein
MKTKPKKKIEEITEYEETSGNVFAAIGSATPEEDLVKAKLIAEISYIIRKKKLTQA